MSNDTASPLPKEQLTAFQRWELASFDPVPKPLTVELSPAAQQAANKLAAAESEKIHKFAYDEGYASGHQAGYAAGIQQAQIETAAIQTIMQNLNQVITVGLSRPVRNFNSDNSFAITISSASACCASSPCLAGSGSNASR